MHICFIITRGDLIGGAQIHVRDTASALHEKGHQATVLVGSIGDFTDQLTERNIDWYDVPELIRSIQPVKDLGAIRELRKLIRSINPDLVSTHTAKAGMVGRIAAFTAGYKSLFTAHGWQFADGIPAKQAIPVLFLEKFLSRICQKIITVSRYDFDLAVRKGAAKAGKMTVIHNGLPWLDSPSRTYPEGQSDASVAVKLLMVARFQPQKDHGTLFKALSQLADYNWSLDLVGDGPDMDFFKTIADQLNLTNRINFLGQRRDVPELMEQSDLFLLITHWEGFPRSIVEAMRSGLPVIATDVGGCGESVREGETGFLIPENDDKILAERIQQMLDNRELFGRFGQMGRTVYEKEFTFNAMLDKTLRVYEEIC